MVVPEGLGGRQRFRGKGGEMRFQREGGGEGERRGWSGINIHKRPERGLEGGVNLHVSFATDPSYRRDNGRELKYCPQVLTLLRRSRSPARGRVPPTLDGSRDARNACTRGNP